MTRSAVFALVVLCCGDVSASAPDALASRVDAAIARGRDFLLQHTPRAATGGGTYWNFAYPMGMRALHAYALLESGVPPDHPTLKRLFSKLATLRPARVYSVALYAMALDSLLRSAERSPDKPSGRVRSKRRVILGRCIEWLLQTRWPGEGTWGYGPHEHERDRWSDYSNTQFAVLALRAALGHGVKVPPECFQEIVETFTANSWPTGEATHLECEGRGWWEQAPAESPQGPLALAPGRITLTARPLAWGYRPRYGGGRMPSQVSMTAAATSSLMVARTGLADALDPVLTRRIDQGIAGGLISLAHEFDTVVPSGNDSLHRNYYYTLYSLEKAMDLGGISRLGGIDWYREQALILLADQRQDGGWGDAAMSREYAQVSTAFALLFLERATRHLRVEPLGPIVTGGGAGDGGLAEGRVFVPSLKGTVALEEVFGRLREHRDRASVDLVQEVLESVAPDRLPDLLPRLASVLDGSRDGVERFARGWIHRISGLPEESDVLRVRDWLRRFEEVRALSAGESESSDPSVEFRLIRVVEDGAATWVLRAAALEGLVRRGVPRAVPAAISLLTAQPLELREAAHRALQTLTGRHTDPPRGSALRGWRESASGWTTYWAAHGARLESRASWSRARRRLESAETAEERAAARAALVALGAEILPRVEEILRGDRFRYDWVLIWEAISGRRWPL